MHRDVPLSTIGPSASGITHCLHLLAEDAARLGLPRTHLAICQVVEICEAERQGNTTPAPAARR